MNTLRELVSNDKNMLLEWRNLPEVTKYMYTEHFITSEEHERWFQKILQDTSCRYWIICCDGEDVGLVNLYNIDLKNQRCHWAFYIASANTRGKGVGSFVEYSILHHVFEVMQLNKLCCEVFAFNDAVIGMHKGFGFKDEGFFREHIFKNGEAFDIVCLAMLHKDWDAIKGETLQKLQRKGIV